MKIIFTLFVLILVVCNVSAQPGSPDKSFGKQGVYLDTSIRALCYAMAIQPDGKILAGGYTEDLEHPFNFGGFYIARYNPDGNIDASFGEDGKYIVRKIPGATPATTVAIVVLPDTKILACGYFITNQPYNDIGLVRLYSDGKIDSSFGTNGFVITKLGKWNEPIGGMAVQPDGKIVVSGNREDDESQPGPEFVLRYLPDGTPDASFGNNGQVFTYLNSLVRPGAVLLQPDGKIVTGSVYGVSTSQFQLVRYNPNGTIDESFGTNGIARLKPVSGFFSQLSSLALQADGKIIAAGGYGSMALARFNAIGIVDSSFGNLGGYTNFYTPDVTAISKSVFITKDNKIVITGNYYKSAAEQVAAVQFNNNGAIDSSFGENGVATGGFAENTYGSDIVSGFGLLQPDGKIIVSGSFLQNDGDNYNVALFRFNGDERRKQILIARIRRWLPHHNGIVWDNMPGVKNYAVQRSADGVRWTTVQSQQSTANSKSSVVNAQLSTVNYYNDASPLAGTNYYRLQTTSVDGAIAYSNVIIINNEPSTISLAPNPAKNVLHIEGLSSSSRIKLTVVDLSGNVAIRHEPSTMNSSYNLNIAALKPGNYWLKLEVNGEVVTKQFVKE
jgi:uncharacterized delta-60 repeat protein